MTECEHGPCTCQVTGGDRFCSRGCETAAGDSLPAPSCECPHDDCGGHREID